MSTEVIFLPFLKPKNRGLGTNFCSEGRIKTLCQNAYNTKPAFSQGGNLSCEFGQTESTCAIKFCLLKNNAYSFPVYQFVHGSLSYLSY